MDLETWRFINSFAPWFSAIGTFSAVALSLYLASKDRRISVKVTANIQDLVEEGVPSREYVCISVVNVGRREAMVTGIGWRIGYFKKRRFYQVPGKSEYSGTIQIRLKDGETAVFMMPLKAEYDDLAWDFPLKEFGFFPVLTVFSLRGEVFTSVGKTFSVRADKFIRNLLLERITKAEK